VIVTQEGVNSIKAQTVTYLVSEGKFVASPPANQQVETIYVVPDRDVASTPATSATPVTQIKPAFKKQQVSPPTAINSPEKLQPKPQEIILDGK
jgi:lipopolysaccharide export system protein LptA